MIPFYQIMMIEINAKKALNAISMAGDVFPVVTSDLEKIISLVEDITICFEENC